MSTKDRVIHILRGIEAHRIRFSFPSGGGTIQVNRLSFDRVARAIEHGHITVKVSNTFAAGVGALYHPDTDTIETPPVIGRGNEGLLLHECVHASFDLAKTALPAVDDEAAAYVADALYFRMTGLPRPRWSAMLHAWAGTVADGILSDYQAGNTPIPAVSGFYWQALRIFIATHPVYIAGPAGHGGSYLHDG
jgi:hypothetical protein